MARNAAAQGHDHFDLLPYISILMCVLGTLLMVTLGFAALSVGPAAGEGWIVSPAPGVKRKNPILVEWDGAVATFHSGGGLVRTAWLEGRRGDAGGQPGDNALPPTGNRTADFQRLIRELESRRETDYALFAVRPSGFANFQAFAQDFRRKKIDVGYEPIGPNRSVKLVAKGGAQ